MSGRHRFFASWSRRRRPAFMIGAAALVVAIAAIAVQIVSASAAGCVGRITLRVVASPEIAGVLSDIGKDWGETRPRIGADCVSVVVTAARSPGVAAELAKLGGGSIDVGQAEAGRPAGAGELPHAVESLGAGEADPETAAAVWVPDSTAWLTRVSAVDRTAFAENAQSVASSPVVIAMPDAVARGTGWPTARMPVAVLGVQLAAHKIRMGMDDPRRDAASLSAAVVLGDVLAVSDEDLPTAVTTLRSMTRATSTEHLFSLFSATDARQRITAAPTSEQAVLALGATHEDAALRAVPLEPAAPPLDYPFAIRSGAPRDVALAAKLFRTALAEQPAAAKLARAGFRDAQGRALAGFPAQTGEPGVILPPGAPLDDHARLGRALGLWTAAHTASRTLALFDLTASMDTAMRTSAGSSTRLQVMLDAAAGGLDLFAADSRVGMWTFGASHQEQLPLAELTPKHRRAFASAMSAARPFGSDTCDLYEVMLAAYRAMLTSYDPSRLNIIVALTDSADSAAGGLRREKFVLDLQKLADPTKPIRVVLIGIDVSARDAADLTEVARAVGGGYFPMTSPEQIQSIFLRALLRVGSN